MQWASIIYYVTMLYMLMFTAVMILFMCYTFIRNAQRWGIMKVHFVWYILCLWKMLRYTEKLKKKNIYKPYFLII